MKNAVIFLAETWLKSQDVVHKTFEISARQSPAAAIEYLMNNYPVIQGTGNQLRLKLISKMSCDNTKIQAEVQELVSSMSEANPERLPGGTTTIDTNQPLLSAAPVDRVVGQSEPSPRA